MTRNFACLVFFKVDSPLKSVVRRLRQVSLNLGDHTTTNNNSNSSVITTNNDSDSLGKSKRQIGYASGRRDSLKPWVLWVVPLHYISNCLFTGLGSVQTCPLRRSGLSTWKSQFSYDHWSQATLSSVSAWMWDSGSSVAWVLPLTLKVS